MKKLLVVLIILVQFLCFDTLSQMSDDFITDTLTEQSLVHDGNERFINLEVSISDTSETIMVRLKEIIDIAEGQNINLSFQKYTVDSPIFSYFVYGDDFSNRSLPIDNSPIDFTNRHSTQYYSTNKNDPTATHVFLMRPIVSGNSPTGIPSETIINVFPFDMFLNTDNISEMLDVIRMGQSSGMSSSAIIPISFTMNHNSNFDPSQFEMLDGVDIETMNYSTTYTSTLTGTALESFLQTLTIVFILSLSILNQSKKRIAIELMHGYSLFKSLVMIYLKWYILPIILFCLFFGIFYSIQYHFHSSLIPYISKILSLIALNYLVSVLLVFILMYILSLNTKINQYHNNGTQYKITLVVSGILKVLLVMSILPTLLSDITTVLDNSAIYINTIRSKSMFENKFTLSNELSTAPIPLVDIPVSEQIEIRKGLDEMGGLYFDASLVTPLQKKLEPVFPGDEIIPDSSITLSKFSTGLVVVNKQFLTQYPLKNAYGKAIDVDIEDSLLIVPESLKEATENVNNRFCKGVCQRVYVEDFSVENMDVQLVQFTTKIEDVLVLVIGDEIGIHYASLPVNGTEIGSPFYNKFSFDQDQLESVRDHLSGHTGGTSIHITNPYDYIISIIQSIGLALKNTSINLFMILSFIILLSYQSLVEFFNSHGKQYAVEQSFGYSPLYSLRFYLIQEIITLIVPLLYITTGMYKRYDIPYFGTPYTIKLNAIILLFSFLITIETVYTLFHLSKNKSKLGPLMKGDTNV